MNKQMSTPEGRQAVSIAVAQQTGGVARIRPELMPRVPRLLLVTGSAHGLSCPACAKCARGAEVHARVMGCTGATYNDDRRATDGEFHSATVASHR